MKKVYLWIMGLAIIVAALPNSIEFTIWLCAGAIIEAIVEKK